MRRYAVETIMDGTVKYYFIRDCETLEIVTLPSRYLKHKIKSKRSPNTVKRSAFSICYYLEYLEELSMEITQVCGLDFERQNEHFVDFLHWRYTKASRRWIIHCGRHIRSIWISIFRSRNGT